MLEAERKIELAALFDNHQLIDVLRRWPAPWDAQDLVSALRPLAPRLYSIASSRKRVGEEAHLTVDVLGYDAFGHAHGGAAGGFGAGCAVVTGALLFIYSQFVVRREVVTPGPVAVPGE